MPIYSCTLFVAVPWLLPVLGLMGFVVVLFPGAPEGSTSCGSGLKRIRRRGHDLRVSSDRLGEPGIGLGIPGYHVVSLENSSFALTKPVRNKASTIDLFYLQRHFLIGRLVKNNIGGV